MTASLLSAGVTQPYDEILFVTDSNGFSGLNVDGTSGFDPTGLDAPLTVCRENRNPFQDLRNDFTTTAMDPLGFSSNPPPTAGMISCGLSFLKWYAANKLTPGRRVRGTFCGVGGTKLSDWMAGFNLPSQFTRINAALAENASNVLVLIVVILGTNDAIAGVSQATNDANLVTFCTNHRNPSNITGATSTTPIVFVGLVPAMVPADPTTFGVIQTSLSNVGTNISNTACCAMTGVTGQTAVTYHFIATSARLIGGTLLPAACAGLL